MLNQSEIIRALLDGLIDSGVDITRSASRPTFARVARRLSTAVG
jgi:hypothetical protein